MRPSGGALLQILVDEQTDKSYYDVNDYSEHFIQIKTSGDMEDNIYNIVIKQHNVTDVFM